MDKLSIAQIAALSMEGDMCFPEEPRKAVKAIFKAAVPSAAAEIVTQALHSEDAKIRLAASKYILDRVLGKDDTLDGGKTVGPLEALQGAVVSNSKPELDFKGQPEGPPRTENGS